MPQVRQTTRGTFLIMRLLRSLYRRIKGLVRAEAIHREIDEELQFHIDARTDENIRHGMSPEEARRDAERRFGNLTQLKERGYEVRGGRWLETLWHDMRYGLRMLWKSPGWTAVMSVTLALGIGLTTAIFGLAYSVLFRALPYPAPDRLVSLQLTNSAVPNVPPFHASAPDWIDWRAQSKLFEDIALTGLEKNFNLTGSGSPEPVQGARTSWNLPAVLGVQPLRGRFFTEEETRRDARVAVLSYGFWDQHFARDPSVVGRTIRLNDQSFEVIGVMPPDFWYPTGDNQVLAPLFIPPDEILSRMQFVYYAIGRLKSGVSLQQAQSEMARIMERLAQQYPTNRHRGVFMEPMGEDTAKSFRTMFYILLATVGCLLLIVCTNLSGLLIVRASARTREFAIRAALGAGAARLRSQTLAEVLPLSLAGIGGGILLAWWLLKVMVLWLPPQLPGLKPIGLNGPVPAFAVALSVLVVLLAGMLPARLASRVQLAGTIQRGARTLASGGAVRHVLVTVQIAVTLALIFAGGLLVRSLVAVMQVNPGFASQGVLTMHLQVSRTKYPTNSQVSNYYHRLVAQVKTVPGVIDAGIVSTLPFTGVPLGGVQLEGKSIDDQLPSNFLSVTPGYFSAMGIPLIRGRDFSEQDGEGAAPVAIIDERLAHRAFGDQDPLGKRLRFGIIKDGMPWLEIVGVVGHIRTDSLESDRRPQMYWPAAQPRSELVFNQNRNALVVRTLGWPESFASAVIERIHKEDPDQPVYNVRTMQDWLDRSLQSRNLLTGLVMLFGGASLLLACLGVYGVVSYGTGLRLREFAIRTALGAQPVDLRRLVLVHALRLWISGSATGLALAWLAGRALQTQLYGVGSTDAMALAAAPCLLLVVVILAGLGPARRAGRIDPAVTLRSD